MGTRNLRPVARNLASVVPAGTTSVELSEVITISTDPNNNIDFTKGFEMLTFPNDEGTWSFRDGTLTIRPRATQTDPIRVVEVGSSPGWVFLPLPSFLFFLLL